MSPRWSEKPPDSPIAYSASTSAPVLLDEEPRAEIAARLLVGDRREDDVAVEPRARRARAGAGSRCTSRPCSSCRSRRVPTGSPRARRRRTAAAATSSDRPRRHRGARSTAAAAACRCRGAERRGSCGCGCGFEQLRLEPDLAQRRARPARPPRARCRADSSCRCAAAPDTVASRHRPGARQRHRRADCHEPNVPRRRRRRSSRGPKRVPSRRRDRTARGRRTRPPRTANAARAERARAAPACGAATTCHFAASVVSPLMSRNGSRRLNVL